MPDSVRILFIGDIIGRPGRMTLKRCLPALLERLRPTLVVGNGENAAGGIGLTGPVARELLESLDVVTSGNHIWDKKEGIDCLTREPRILRPANYPAVNPGQGTFVFESPNGVRIGVLNLQGRVFMEPLECPFRTADDCLEGLRKQTPLILVDFHAEATSEKQALGWHLDGRVTAVIGTHTHVLTADGRILPGGTAYLTDAGMVGGTDSVIGIRPEQALRRFFTSRPYRFEPATGRMTLTAAFIEADPETGRALAIRTETVTEEGDD